MKNIRKNHEPRSLAHHRCQAHADYDNCEKQELRECLCAEQGRICAYCTQRIRAEVGGMKIEHWHCQDRYPAEQLDYGNLLGACLGGERRPRTDQHCDTRKGNTDFCRNPANPNHDVEAMIRYLGDGRIMSDDEVFNREINEVLNLNHPQLKRNRKAVLDSFTDTLGNRRVGRPYVQRKIAEWIAPIGGELHPYCMVVVYWLRKKLTRI